MTLLCCKFLHPALHTIGYCWLRHGNLYCSDITYKYEDFIGKMERIRHRTIVFDSRTMSALIFFNSDFRLCFGTETALADDLRRDIDRGVHALCSGDVTFLHGVPVGEIWLVAIEWRAFSNVTPSLWNSPPQYARQALLLIIFHCIIKAELFRQSFN